MTKKQKQIQLQFDYFDGLQEVHNFHSTFDIIKIKDINENSGLSADIMVDFNTENDSEVELPSKKLTFLELWKYADEIYLGSPSTNHCFIEDFNLEEVGGKKVIKVSFGS